MDLTYLLFLQLLYLASATDSEREWRVKRRAIDPPSSGDKLSCHESKITILCSPRTSVYITYAMYGRHFLNAVCVRGGRPGTQQLCRSPDALSLSRALCLGKRRCVLDVNHDSVGIPMNKDGEECLNNNNYMRVEYRCLSDCKTPRLNRGVLRIGSRFLVGSNLTVKCKPGFQPENNGSVINRITCSEDGKWIGAEAKCRDVNECRDESLNNCDGHADCRNTFGSYQCTCSSGYRGDGVTCSPANEDRSWARATQNETYDIVTDLNCGGKIYDSRGIISSPNFPFSYPNRANCQWVITVPPSHTIELEFEKFHLEGRQPGRGCERDYLSIYDGPRKDSHKWIATLCGDDIPAKQRSTSNQLRLEFKTDVAVTYKGFEVLFKGNNLLSKCTNFKGPAYEGIIIKSGSENDFVRSGDFVILGCQDGYNVSDTNLKRVCGNENNWNDISNPCLPIQCGKPNTHMNPGVMLSGTSDDYRYNGTPLKFSCKSGFLPVRDPDVQLTIQCNKQGQWSNEGDPAIPACQALLCEVTSDLKPPEKGYWDMVDPFGYTIDAEVGIYVNYSSSISYTCANGYQLIGEQTRICSWQNKKEWSGSLVECKEDNGINGVTNFQIALISSILSVVVIVLVGGALLYSCLRKKGKNGQVTPQFPRSERSMQQFHNYGYNPQHESSEFRYSTTHSRGQQLGLNSNSNFSAVPLPYGNNFSPNYQHTKPPVFPSSVPASAPTWEDMPQMVNLVPTSFNTFNGTNEDRRYNNHQQYTTNSPQEENNTNKQNKTTRGKR